MRVLIELGADIDKAPNIGATPLCIAAQDGHEAVVRVLIEAGADVNKARNDGETPLTISMTHIFNVAQGGHAGIVRMLKDAGAGDGRVYIDELD